MTNPTWNPTADYWQTPATGLFGTPDPYNVTFPKRGSTRAGTLYAHPRQPNTDQPELLPTPRAADMHGSMTAPAAAGNGTLPEVLGTRLLPTPSAAMATRGPSKDVGGTRPSGQQRQIDLNTVVVREMSVQ